MRGRVTKPGVGAMLLRAAPPALGFGIVALFGGYAVLGQNGMLAYGDYQRQIARHEQVMAKLDRQRAVLQNRVDLLDPRHANPDMVDELVRKQLNVAHPDEVIVPLR
jgi:cell division protein FtsB